jgi:hypothetical protein
MKKYQAGHYHVELINNDGPRFILYDLVLTAKQAREMFTSLKFGGLDVLEATFKHV